MLIQLTGRTEAYHSQTPFTWKELVENILEPAYNGTAKDEDVALLFTLLAMGISKDHMKQPDDPAARRYAHLARISLMLGEDLLCTKSLVVIICLVRLYLLSNVNWLTCLSTLAWSCLVVSNFPGSCGRF